MKSTLCKRTVSAWKHPRWSGSFKILALLVAAGLGGWPFNSALAVPADPTPRDITQPDGTKIQVRLRGDEFFHWAETTNGYAVVKDTDNFWKYAQPAMNQAEFRVIKSARVGASDPARLGLRKHDLPDAKVLRKHIQERRKALNMEPDGVTTQTKAQATAQTASQATGSSSGTVRPHIAVSGVKSIKNIVILACFSNHWDYANNTVLPAYGRVDTNEYYNLYNQAGYSADGAVGSVKDYYREISYGKLTIDSTITMWVRLPRESAYYGFGAHGGLPAVMVADAIEAAAAAGFDFSQGDSDGDGWVDVLDVLHSGYGEESTGDTNDVWSVKGGLSSVVTKNGVKMYNYHEEPALRGSSGNGIERIGTICHETGHFFGLPDLYDYSPLTDGLGNWCLMSGASWNGNSGTSPGHPSAWAKVFLGFAKTVPVHSKNGFSLPRVEDNAIVGILRDGSTNQEYFLIENRAKTGFDNSTQINPGLLIYHVDQKNANNDLGTWPHPAVKVEEADGNDSLGMTGGGTQAGDAWTSTSGLAGGWSDRTGNTNTTAMLYQTGSLYSRTDNAALYTYNSINNFSTAGSNMTFNVQSLKTDAPTQNALPEPFTVAWAPSSQTTKYEVQEGSPATLTSFTDGAESEDAMRDNWQVAGKTLCVVTNASHGGSACYVLQQANYGAVQSLVLRQPFKVTASTVIAFYLMSHISAGNGFLRCELSNDNGNNWKTLGTYNDYIDPWALHSYNHTAINAAGINSGDTCLLRFIVDIEYTLGWSTFPRFGFAIDDISLTGIEMAGYNGWTSLANNVASNSYTIGGKATGTYAYRIQPYANGAWQGFGNVGETIVRPNQAPVWTINPIAGTGGNVAMPYASNIGNQATDEINDVMTFSKVSGPGWLSVSTDGTMAGTPPPGSAGTNTFTVRVTDSAGAYNDATLAIPVNTPLANTSIADWRMNESSGPTLYDSVSNFNGTAAGSLVYGLTGAPNGAAGNSAVGFDGATTSVSVPALNLNTNTLTLTALIKLNGAQSYRAPVFMWRGTGFGLRFDDGSGLANNNLSPVWNGSGWLPSLVVPTNQWTFVALSVGPTNLTVYMATNLAVASSVINNANVVAAFDSTSYIGWDSNYSGARHFNGTMDDVAIFGRTLGSSEINQLAAAAFAQATPVVTLTSPASGGVLTNATITVSASVVTNNHNITAVRFYAGLNRLGEITASPYTYNWSGMTNGNYALSAKTLYDGGNLVVSAPVTITVSNAVTFATDPTNIVASVTGNSLILSWPSDHKGWTLQVQTNMLSAGLGTNWADVPGSTSANAITNTINPTSGAVFYRLKYTP